MDYSTSFNAAVNHVMLYEVGGWWNLAAPGARDGTNARACGYVNDEKDRGGETKYGIAKNANPDLDIHSLDWDAALRVYYKRYWLAADCDNISAVAPRYAVLHFDIAVNGGPGRAGKFLQTSVGAAVDGDVGPHTIDMLTTFLASNDEIALCNNVSDLRAQFYRSIVEHDSSQQRFLNGWLRRTEEMRTFTTDPAATFS